MHHRRIQRAVGLLRRIASCSILEKLNEILLHRHSRRRRSRRSDRLQINKSVNLIFRYSCWSLPALRQVKERLLDVLTAGAGKEQLRTGFVDPHGEMKVLHAHLAGTAAAARIVFARIGLPPTPALEINFVLVLVILCFRPECRQFLRSNLRPYVCHVSGFLCPEPNYAC